MDAIKQLKSISLAMLVRTFDSKSIVLLSTHKSLGNPQFLLPLLTIFLLLFLL
jgi:hypothetical protein